MDRTTIIIICVGAFLLFLCFLLTIASFSSDKFMDNYKKLLKKKTNSVFTVSAFLKIINAKYLKNKVSIVPINEDGGDFYNSKKKIIGFNMKSENSLAGFAVIAHELGHAYQDISEGKLQSFNNQRRTGAFIGKLFLPIFIIGIVLAFVFQEYYITVLISTLAILILIILLAIVIKTKTIAIEKDASNRGIQMLKEFLPDDEVKECKKLLDSARLTYWADLIKLLLSWSGLTSKTEMFR